MNIMKINVILASTRQGGIGFKNKLPWFIKDDLKHFREITKQSGYINIIIMGRNTWESLPKKPLAGRTNIILTQKGIDIESYENTITKSSLIDALNTSTSLSHTHDINLSIIGGESVYKGFNNLCNKINTGENISFRKMYNHSLYHTMIEEEYECDRFFKPNIKDYILVSKERKTVVDELTKNNIRVCYMHYKSK